MRKNLSIYFAMLLAGLVSVACIIAVPEKIYGSSLPDTQPVTYTNTIQIHEDMPVFTAQLDMWQKPASAENLYEYEASITITDEYGEVLQYITDLEISYRKDFRTDSRVILIDPANPANFHFADYNNDGFLDMAVRQATDGTRINDPHYFWLWDAKLQQFERSYELEELSGASPLSLSHDGNVRTFLRHTLEHYVWETHKFVDGVLVPYITRERKPIQVGEDSTYKTIITNHINETKSIMLEPF